MKILKSVLMFEAKRFLCKRNSILLIILIILALGFLQYGIFEYKDILKRKEKFQEIEKIKVNSYVTWSQYGTYGFRMIFIPSPFSVFFINSGIIPDMTAYVDSGERLKIYLPLKGKNVFKMIRSNFTDFSGIILFFGTLLSILYGFDTFRGKEYLKFLSSLSSGRKVFFSMVLTRVLLLFITFLAIISCALLLALINGLFIPVDKFLGYFILMIFMVSLFFFLLGTVFSSIKSVTMSITAVLSCWFVLIYVIPTTVNIFISSRSDFITPVYELEIEKLKIVMAFEKRAIDSGVTYKYGENLTDDVRKYVLSYWKNEFIRINSLEENMRKQMKNNVSIYHRLSNLFPTTFYIAVNNEIDSRGYENLIDFYRIVQINKKKFFHFFIKKEYFSDSKSKKIEPFLKLGENVYFGRNKLPECFEFGLFINFLYISMLYIWLIPGL